MLINLKGAAMADATRPTPLASSGATGPWSLNATGTEVGPGNSGLTETSTLTGAAAAGTGPVGGQYRGKFKELP